MGRNVNTVECIYVKSLILEEITKVINSPLFFASYDQRHAIENMHTCRTAARGGRITQCPKCYTRTVIYNPCNTRGCPICSARNKILWQKKLSKKLLPVSHYHLVFSIPHAFTPTWLRNKKKVAEILFKSAGKVIAELRIQTGLLCGSALDFQSHGKGMCYKPHIHCILSDGGINKEGKWEKLGTLRYTKMANRFRELAYKELLRQIAIESLPNSKEINEGEWYIYPEYHQDSGKSLVGYLGHSACGAVINLKQSFDITESTIRFSETHNGKQIETKLEKRTFVERYLNHIPPSGLVTIRYYGLYSNQHTEELKAIRKDFEVEQEVEEEVIIDLCPNCRTKMFTLVLFPVGTDPEEIELFCSRSPPRLLPVYKYK